MEEQRISIETAKLAKEKGFKEHCEYSYYEITEDCYYDDIRNHEKYLAHSKGEVTLTSRLASEWNYNAFKAPTQPLLQRWLREVHKIYVTALPSYTDTSDNKKHYFELFYGKTLRLFGDKYSYFPTYEVALEVGLFEALNLIKNE